MLHSDFIFYSRTIIILFPISDSAQFFPTPESQSGFFCINAQISQD